jgi:hypothetical protein
MEINNQKRDRLFEFCLLALQYKVLLTVIRAGSIWNIAEIRSIMECSSEFLLFSSLTGIYALPK